MSEFYLVYLFCLRACSALTYFDLPLLCTFVLFWVRCQAGPEFDACKSAGTMLNLDALSSRLGNKAAGHFECQKLVVSGVKKHST